MDKYDVDKLKAVTLYILKKCGATDYIHLFKILYFAEREHYADYPCQHREGTGGKRYGQRCGCRDRRDQRWGH